MADLQSARLLGVLVLFLFLFLFLINRFHRQRFPKNIELIVLAPDLRQALVVLTEIVGPAGRMLVRKQSLMTIVLVRGKKGFLGNGDRRHTDAPHTPKNVKTHRQFRTRGPT